MVTTVGAAASATGLDPATVRPAATSTATPSGANLRSGSRICELLTTRIQRGSAAHLPGEGECRRGGEVDRRLGRRERLDVVLPRRPMAVEPAEDVHSVRRAGPHPGQRAVEDGPVRALDYAAGQHRG